MGASAQFGFETSVSYEHGWGSSATRTRTTALEFHHRLAPRTKTKGKMFLIQHIIKVGLRFEGDYKHLEFVPEAKSIGLLAVLSACVCDEYTWQFSVIFALMAFCTQLAGCQTGRPTGRGTKCQKGKKMPK